MILSPRLLKIAQMVKFDTAADIGTDHAKIPVYLVQNNICRKVIASDIAQGPVMSSIKTVKRSGYNSLIEIRMGNGLETISENEADTIIVAGMGGDLISQILKKGLNVCVTAKEIILQPMTHIPELRKFLRSSGFCIIDELLVKEKSKIYTVIKTVVGNEENLYKNEADYIISPILLKNNDPLLKEYANKMLIKYKREFQGVKRASIVNDETVENLNSIIEKLEKIYEIAKNN